MGAHAKKSGCDIHRMRCIFPVLSAIPEEKPENMNYLTICSCRYTGRNGFRDRTETTKNSGNRCSGTTQKWVQSPLLGCFWPDFWAESPLSGKNKHLFEVSLDKQTDVRWKRGQKGTKGTNFVPIFVPSKTPVYRNKPDFLESRFNGRGQTGDKQGTKMGTKTPKWGILIRPM